MNDFLKFKKMLTPIFIQILFWIGIVVCVIAGILEIVSGATAPYGGGGSMDMRQESCTSLATILR